MKMISRAPAMMRWMAALLLAGASAVALADNKYEVTGSNTFASNLKLDEPIDVNMEVNGVKLSSIFFDKAKMQAFVILHNRTPISVSPKIAVSLFDAKGKLLATGIDVSPFSFSGDNIGAGDQKNIQLSFDKFINDYKNVSRFQMVLSLGQNKQSQGSSNSNNNSNDGALNRSY